MESIASYPIYIFYALLTSVQYSPNHKINPINILKVNVVPEC